MYYRTNDTLPEIQLGVRHNPIYATCSIGKKLYDIRCFQKGQDFNQTELALLENVTHQRISVRLKNICLKAVRELQPHPDHVDVLLHYLRQSGTGLN